MTPLPPASTEPSTDPSTESPKDPSLDAATPSSTEDLAPASVRSSSSASVQKPPRAVAQSTPNNLRQARLLDTTEGVPPPERPQRRGFSGQGRLATTIVLLCFILIALDRAGLFSTLHPLVVILYSWFILLSAFGILLGLLNLLYLHMQRIAGGQPEWGFSLLLVATGLTTLVAGLLQASGVTNPIVEWIFDALLAPGAATLYALVIFFMAAAAYRYLRLTAPGGAWMLAGALLMLIMQMPASANFLPPFLKDSMNWLLQAPVMATFRGALLGSALALLLVGVRHLLGRAAS